MLKRCLIILIACEYLFIFGVLLNYDNAWIHPEKILTHDWVLRNGTALKLEDLQRGLNTAIIELGHPRITRPFSNLFELVDAKFRAWLWRFIPPHPSLSLSWPLSFILVPVLLRRFFRNIGCGEDIALGGVCLYLASIGFLEPLIMLFHPGKNFVNIFAVLALFLASALQVRIQKDQTLSAGDTRSYHKQYGVLYTAIFWSFFWDETGVFIYVLIFIFFAPIFWRGTNKARRFLSLGTFLLLPLVYYLIIRAILPVLETRLYRKKFDISEYQAFPSLADFLFPNLRNLFTNIQWLFQDHLHLDFNISAYPTIFLQVLAVVYHLSFLCFVSLLIYSLLRYFREKRQIDHAHHEIRRVFYFILSSVVLLYAYAYFHTFQLSHNAKIWGACWYGNLFSLIFVIFVTSALKFIASVVPWNRRQLVITGLCAVFVLNSLIFTTYRNNIFKLENMFHEISPRDIWSKINQSEQYSFLESYRRHIATWRYTLDTWTAKRFRWDHLIPERFPQKQFLSYYTTFLKVELAPQFQAQRLQHAPLSLPEQIQYADVNGDQKMDALYFDAGRTNEIRVSLSTGERFTEPRTWIRYRESVPEQIHYADVNGDHQADALYFDVGRTNTILASLSTGKRFTEPISWIGYRESVPEQIHYADVNHDGRADALYFDVFRSHEIIVGFSTGSSVPHFLRRECQGLMIGIVVPGQMQYADISGDQELEALYFDTFRSHRLWSIGLTNQQIIPFKWDLANGHIPEQIRYADVNGDGKAEILYFDLFGNRGIWVSSLIGSEFTQPVEWARLPDALPEQLQYADVNGDGKMDLLYFDTARTKGLWVGLSTGSQFSEPVQWGQYQDSLPEQLQYADVNDDGKMDALYFDSVQNSVQVSLSTGTGFTEPTTWLQIR
jgi:hypothetical protein